MEYLEGISQGEESKKEEGEVELVTPIIAPDAAEVISER